MATTNFTIKQGETWSKVLNLEDSDCVPTMLADFNSNPYMYFAGMATKTGETSVPVHFKYGEVETKTYGRGNGRKTITGIFDVVLYIPADEVGSCSVVGNSTKTECNSAGGTWTVDASASLLTTNKMAIGDWNYEIRKGTALDVSGVESSETILYGTITIEESSLDLSAGSSFTFSTPN
jgi:hypothetical protein